jgi:hypothetical protein
MSSLMMRSRAESAGLSVRRVTHSIDRREEFACDKKDQFARDMVFQHQDNVLSGLPVKMFSLPGESWILENEIFRSRDRACFTCVEWNERTFLRSGKNAPGWKGKFYPVITPNGPCDAFATTNATLFKADFYSLFTASRSLTPDVFGGDDRRRWFFIKKKHNAFWIDLCGTLSFKNLTAVSNVRAWTHYSPGHPVSFAITFMRGRDNFQSDQDRVSSLISALTFCNAIEVLEHDMVSYAGVGGSPMAIFIASLRTVKQKKLSKCHKRAVLEVRQ